MKKESNPPPPLPPANDKMAYDGVNSFQQPVFARPTPPPPPPKKEG